MGTVNKYNMQKNRIPMYKVYAFKNCFSKSYVYLNSVIFILFNNRN